MYELARGPLMWAATIICLCGIIFRTIQLARLTRKKEITPYTAVRAKKPEPSRLSPEEQKLERVVAFQNSLLGKHPIMAIVSTVFHVCLFAAPVFALGHSLLLRESWGFLFPSLPDGLIDLMTIILMACALFFLVRRIAVPQVQAISSGVDYLLLLITAVPFLTGFFAYHQWLDYRTVITLHILAGELMLIAVPFTKLGHMVFFFFIRILVGGEFSFWRGNRTWST